MQILEVAFSGIAGTVIGFLLSYALEKHREKSRENKEREATITRILRQVSYILNPLKSVAEYLSNPNLQSIDRVAHFVTSMEHLRESVFSLNDAVHDAPPINPTLDEQLSTLRSDLGRLVRLSGDIQVRIPPPIAIPPSSFTPSGMMTPHERDPLNRLEEQARGYVDQARQLVDQAIRHGEQIQQQLKTYASR